MLRERRRANLSARGWFIRGGMALLDCHGYLMLYCWVGGYVEGHQFGVKMDRLWGSERGK